MTTGGSAQARSGRSLGDFDRAMLVHADQAFELHRPLPVAGTVRTLTVSVWRQDGSDTALFQTTRQDGTVVIDRGRLQVREPIC